MPTTTTKVGVTIDVSGEDILLILPSVPYGNCYRYLQCVGRYNMFFFQTLNSAPLGHQNKNRLGKHNIIFLSEQ